MPRIFVAALLIALSAQRATGECSLGRLAVPLPDVRLAICRRQGPSL